ncbi:putative C6 finger domain protein [Aspergillus ambiguus]|uniref:putative C6 finger domain protein n=1 Tax=Aspergillus ambiguus TaxID=176160 RepID=UPI003CCDAE8F
MPAVIESMTPTPNPQGAVMDSSTADKKRNKLGYHRTSVACVHCRRRKIRCLVAADDAQGRCENCIRLRKECQFFPVDQQPPMEKKSRPNSRLETASTDPSTASSSPPAVSGADQADAFFPYQPIPLSSAQDVPTNFNAAAFPGNPMTPYAPAERPMGSSEFAPNPALDPPVPWDEYTTISDPQMLAALSSTKPGLVNMSPNVWSPPQNAMAPMPTTSPLQGAPSIPSQAQTLSPAPTYAVQPDGSVWQMPPPARSMTFPAQPDMTTAPYANPGQFQQPIPPDLKRRMTSPPQSFPTNPINPQSPPPADLQAGPTSVSYPGQPAPMGFPTWQDMNSMSSMNVVQYPMYTGDTTQQAAFGGPPPMGHPGPGQAPP